MGCKYKLMIPLSLRFIALHITTQYIYDTTLALHYNTCVLKSLLTSIQYMKAAYFAHISFT